jgi:hypothetical protein
LTTTASSGSADGAGGRALPAGGGAVVTGGAGGTETASWARCCAGATVIADVEAGAVAAGRDLGPLGDAAGHRGHHGRGRRRHLADALTPTADRLCSTTPRYSGGGGKPWQQERTTGAGVGQRVPDGDLHVHVRAEDDRGRRTDRS